MWSSTDIPFSSYAVASAHPRHDHSALYTKVPSSVIPGQFIPQALRTSRHLDVRKLAANLSEWQALVAQALTDSTTTPTQQAYQSGTLPP
eukprot:3203518-Rhodomonas_salina.1